MRGERSRCVVFYASKEEANIVCFRNYLNKAYPKIELVAFSDGADAVMYFNNKHNHQAAPCVIIMDVVMPSKTGIEVLEEIRKHPQHNNTPAVLITKATFQYEHVVEEKLNAKLVIKPNSDQQKRTLISDVFAFCGLDALDNLSLGE